MKYKGRIHIEQNLEFMNPNHAISVHLAWKLALRHAVSTRVAGNLEPEELGRTDRCELGLWLASPAACFEGIAELNEIHRRFHESAGRLVRAIRCGDPAAAIAREEADMEDLSASLVVRLSDGSMASRP